MMMAYVTATLVDEICVICLLNDDLLYRCPVLLVTGALASFNHTVHTLAGFMLAKMEKNKVEIIEVEGVANVLEENVSVCNNKYKRQRKMKQ